MTGNLEENLRIIQNNIQSEIAKLEEKNIPLILAVSKKQPSEKIRTLYSLGVRDFGENYFQEAIEKKDSLKDLEIQWHYIGKIQRKKLKDIVGNFDLIQTVSRFEEVEKIQEIAAKKNITQKILIQVNIANEESKGGVSVKELKSLVEKTLACENVLLDGLMFFPPLSRDENETLGWFDQCQKVFEELQKKIKTPLKVLSLGTSSDYTLAIQKGSTMVRIGEALMGPRLK